MKQFLLPHPTDAHGVVRLTGDDYRYLARVRRLSEGDVFTARLPDGTETRALVQAVSSDAIVCECLAPAEQMAGALLPPILLFQALPKGAKIDQIVRQAAEGGVAEIIPFVSTYTMPKLKKAEGTAGKINRWKRIVKEARQQSGSVVETCVREACTLDAVFSYWEAVTIRYKNPTGVLLHQEPFAVNSSFHHCLAGNPDCAAAVVGPEGGFSPEEAERFVRAGFKPLVIGANVLRTETAAVYAVAAIRILLLESAEWMLKTL
ncbi:MAG: RsmE family RNA methyltransferase [Treponema sp.]|jgi:16S rRNA (uracil1498-N3)-methyltransferase|nr:RsmE family RNA methyltransferase [Treponema sp.]